MRNWKRCSVLSWKQYSEHPKQYSPNQSQYYAPPPHRPVTNPKPRCSTSALDTPQQEPAGKNQQRMDVTQFARSFSLGRYRHA